MKHKLIAAGLIPLMLGMAACDNQQVGTIAGAAAGAAAGRAIGGSGSGGYIGLLLGALAGGYLGGKAGEWMSERDRQKVASTTNTALETGKNGQSYSWTNPDSGNKGQVTPTRTFSQNGQTCRSFAQSASAPDGKTAADTGTACKQADGTWRIIS